jgi:hypothetical protein
MFLTNTIRNKTLSRNFKSDFDCDLVYLKGLDLMMVILDNAKAI